MAYRIEFTPRAERQLKRLSGPIRHRIKRKIVTLADNPRPHGVEKLRGEEGFLRVRVGDYHILYRVEDDRLLVLVVKIGHRRDVYRGL